MGTCANIVCPVDCVLGDWGAWEPKNGSNVELVRNRDITTPQQGAGKACSNEEQYRKFSQVCQDRVVYGRWTSCTKTCGSGHRWRWRTHYMCSQKAVLTYHMKF